jgi:hypothetical protein
MVFSLTDEVKDRASRDRAAARQSLVLEFAGQRKLCSAKRSTAQPVRNYDRTEAPPIPAKAGIHA